MAYQMAYAVRDACGLTIAKLVMADRIRSSRKLTNGLTGTREPLFGPNASADLKRHFALTKAILVRVLLSHRSGKVASPSQ